jgi:enoyl-CoA hydratase/carnithine racemase
VLSKSSIMKKTIDKEKHGDFLGFEKLTVTEDGAVLFVEIDAPPMNLMGPELIRDLISLMQKAEADSRIQVLVFRSSDPDFFISHVDVIKTKENLDAVMKLNGEASIGLMLHYLSTSRLVTIAQIEGRVRGVGSEFVLACDMRFAAQESAIFSQFEPAFGVIPGAGGAQHLPRLMGRGRALEVMLSAEDYTAELAERYGWINRSLPASELGKFVNSLAQRIAKFPASGRAIVKERVNATSLPSIDDFRRDTDLIYEAVRKGDFQNWMQAAMNRGFQNREFELNLATMLGDLPVEITKDKK